MGNVTISCSESACKKRISEARNMSLEELKKQADTCNSCGDWLIKTNQIATITANEVASMYANKFNENFYRK